MDKVPYFNTGKIMKEIFGNIPIGHIDVTDQDDLHAENVC